MKEVNAFTVRINDDMFIQLEDYCKKIGCSRNSAVQMLLNFGILYAKNHGIFEERKDEV